MRLVFAGTPDFAVPALDALLRSAHEVAGVWTQPDRPAGRGRKLQASPVKRHALAAGLPVFQPQSLKTGAVRQEIAALRPEIMIVVAYGLILPRAVLDIPRHGCVNIHASLLPRWRGAAPIQRAILAGDEQTGVTIMQMDEGLDTGAKLRQVKIAIAPDDTGGTLHAKLARLGAQALLETLEELARAAVRPVPQYDAHATHAPKLRKEEALLDWRKPAVQLAREVRAFNPWPVSYTLLNGETLRVWRAEKTGDGAAAPPGTIVDAGRQGISVATGAGALRLLTVQRPGGKPVGAGEFVNAQAPLMGVVLGP